jgi:O-antigen/teichoic acid export membrane protein
MGIVFRQSVKSSIVTFTGAILGALTLYLGPRFIEKQEFGFVRSVLPEQAALAAQILFLGVNITMMVYVHKYNITDKRRTALVSMTFVMPLFTFALLTAIYFLFRAQFIQLFQARDVPLLLEFYAWLPLLTVFYIYLLALEQYLVAHLKVAAATFMREVLLRLLTVALILLFGYGLISFPQFVHGSVIAFLIPIAVLAVLALRTGHFKLGFQWNVFSREERKELASFTWFHFLLTISINLLAKIDIILLGMWASFSAVAVYGIALYILSFLQIPYRAMMNASFPILTKAYHDGEMDKVNDVYVRSSLNMFIASVGLAAIICCNLHNAVAMLPAGYEAITPLVLILIVGKLVDVSTGMNDQLLSISNYYRFSFFVSISIVALLIVLNYYLIRDYDYYGAAIATTVAMAIYNAAKVIFINKKMKLSPFSKESWLVMLAGLVAVGGSLLLPKLPHPITDAVLRTLVISVVYVLLLLILKPSTDLVDYVASVKRNKRLF